MTITKFEKSLKHIAGYILKFLMCVLVLGMLLASIDLAYEFYIAITQPPVGLINTHKLYSFFSLILIIAVGYELLKSMFFIVGNSKIPVRSIIKISMIAIANKVITLDLKEVSMQTMIGIGVIITSLGLAFFLLHFKAEEGNDLED